MRFVMILTLMEALLAWAAPVRGDVLDDLFRGDPNEKCLAGEVNRNSGSAEHPMWGCVRPEAPGLFSDCRPNGVMCLLDLEGPITQEVATAIRHVAARTKRPAHLSLRANTPGGDVAAAIEIGRILRQNQGSFSNGRDDICASACLFVYAGAVMRHRDGKFVIHRPYRTSTESLDVATAQADYARRRDGIRAYLAEMNVSESLWDAMNAVPPEQGRRLSRQELDGFGLTLFDPVFDERANAKNARDLGLTMQEYLRRKAQNDACHEKAYALGNPWEKPALDAAIECDRRWPTRLYKQR